MRTLETSYSSPELDSPVVKFQEQAPYIERFHKLDEKISKFINTVTIIIGVFVAAVPFVFKNHFPPKSFYEWLLIALIFFTFVSLCSLWSFLFRALKLVNVPRMPFNEEIVELFKLNQNVNTIFFCFNQNMSKCI